MDEEKVLSFLQGALRLRNPRTMREVDLPSEARPDFVLRDGARTVVVDVKRGRAGVTSLAQLVFYRDMLTRRTGKHPTLVLAATAFTEAVEALARESDVKLVLLPVDLLPPSGPAKAEAAGQVATPAAWRVTYALLEKGSSSIRQLSKSAHVSYGWAHHTVRALQALGVAEQRGSVVRLTDRDRLLNGVAWDRPLRSLQRAELRTNYGSVEEGARELTRGLRRRKLSFAFTAHTAAGIYTGYGFRGDRFHLYADPKQVEPMVESGKGPILHVYAADRDLDGVEEREGILLASKPQVLLDLAGMGAGARDILNAMVSSLART